MTSLFSGRCYAVAFLLPLFTAKPSVMSYLYNYQCIRVVHRLIYHDVQRVRMRRNLTTRAEPEWLNVQASERFAQSDILDDEQQEKMHRLFSF